MHNYGVDGLGIVSNTMRTSTETGLDDHCHFVFSVSISGESWPPLYLGPLGVGVRTDVKVPSSGLVE